MIKVIQGDIVTNTDYVYEEGADFYYTYWKPGTTSYNLFGFDFLRSRFTGCIGIGRVKTPPMFLLKKIDSAIDIRPVHEFENWDKFWDWLMEEYCIEIL